MEIIFTDESKMDLDWWHKSGNVAVLKRIRLLLESIMKTPYQGIGKPEPLKYNLSGKWSRRITDFDRMVYEIKDEVIIIHTLRGHYN